MNKDTYNIPADELAKTPASILANRLGCAPSTVHRRRHRAGVEFKGERIPPPGRPVTFNWSALDPSKSITENMALTGCDNREYVGLKRRQLRSANVIAVPAAAGGSESTPRAESAAWHQQIVMPLICEHEDCQSFETHEYIRTAEDVEFEEELPMTEEDRAFWTDEPIALCQVHAGNRQRHNGLRTENEDLRDEARNALRLAESAAEVAFNERDRLVSENERLQAHLDELTASTIHSCGDHCQRPNCVRRREMAAMREAIQEAYDAIKASPYPDQQALTKLKPFITP